MPNPGPDVTLIRHGETTWSLSGRHTGRTDLDLTAEGERQAIDLRPLLADRSFDVVAVSPLRRAQLTAELAGLHSTAVLDELSEWDYGDLEGLTTEEIRARLPDWSVWQGPWPGGETAAQMAERADRVIEWVLGRANGSCVALVAHGHILRVLAARWLRTDVSAGQWWALDTASVSELGWEHGRPVLRRWNVTAGPLPA